MNETPAEDDRLRAEADLKEWMRESVKRRQHLVTPLKHHQNPYSHFIQAIHPGVLDHRAIKAMVRACKSQMAALAASNPPLPARGSGLIGAVACRTCHPAQYQRWKQSQHAHAYETLVHIDRAFDFECLPCHTTGNRFEGDLWEASEIGNPEGVQCESCHGHGVKHARFRGDILRSPDAKICRQCHTPRDSPNFDFQSYLTKPICFSSAK